MEQVNSQTQSVSANAPILTQEKMKELYRAATPQQLLDALYFIADAASRGQLDLFLIGDTAKQVKNQESLSGDKVTVGIRRNEWVSGRGDLMRIFLEHAIRQNPEEKENKLIYTLVGIPIEVKLYEDNPAITSFEQIFYRYESWNLPNPLKGFDEKYG